MKYASTLFVSLLLALIGSVSTADSFLPTVRPKGKLSTPGDLPNFHEVITGQIFRGGQPTPNGIRTLAKNGVKAIIDLRIESPLDSMQEKKLAESLGMKYFYMPMSPINTPSEREVAQIENVLLSDPSLRPVFVHCHYGEDRSGLIIGLHRVFKEQPALTPAQAYDEMLKYGFHPSLRDLANYFFAKTNWRP